MKAITNAKIALENGVIENGYIIFDNLIKEIGVGACPAVNEVIDAKGNYVFAGLIDMHVHGFMGDDTMDGDFDGMARIQKALAKNGVTSFCPTTMTMSLDDIKRALDVIRKAKQNEEGAQIVGANVEGPFISPLKKGAQSDEHIISPDADFILQNKDVISLVTVAPEVDGGIDFISKVRENSDIVISTGHTNADSDVAKKAVAKGASHVTHLFNAMPPMNHREPGIVGAALADDSVSVELIADTFHVNPLLYPMLARVKGDKLILITDCMRAGGLTDGNYSLGGQDVSVNGVECRLQDGTIAGSILTLNKAVLNLSIHANIPLHEAAKHASLYPARVLGIDHLLGSLAPSKHANLFIADNQMNVLSTFINGNLQK